MKTQPSISDLISRPLSATTAEIQGRRRHSMKGRGTALQPLGRFEDTHAEVIDDGWYLSPEDQPANKVPTDIQHETVGKIISRNQSPDVPFEQSINPYRGCEHGCVYCYARPSHEYLNLSSGLDFETKIFSKTNAAQALEKEITEPNYQCKPIVIGANTDGYQAAEKKYHITRSILEVLDKYDHPVNIVTKSSLVLRDIDILERLAQRNLVSVAISVTTLDNSLKRTLEPRAASPNARLKTIKALSDKGIPVTVLVAPIIPAINDHELEQIVKACAEAGATQAHYIFLRLPYAVKELFSSWLLEHFPMRAKHVLNLMAASHQGQAYRAKFGERMSGSGAYAQMIKKRFEKIAQQCGMQARESVELDTAKFELKSPAHAQYSLF